ncbi:DUF4365 domain-containing protein [Sneathiella aquimaris]|uniref:DUF4365 domain-containing protein n=1 Tax=Sneathiella aquimaris TaxID=2599305 RepID=UPI00146E83C3|nr:DUF4365 domain-containing protein [Sneathiella aquimaris]
MEGFTESSPTEWIVREVSERDYGIDAYIEQTTKEGYVTGNLMSVQLKGTSSLSWKMSSDGIMTTRSPSIKTTTANYWLSMPVPVFLFVADLSEGNIYYLSVKSALRSQFDNLESQDSISFQMKNALNIKSTDGLQILTALYRRERLHDHFSFHITNLINQISAFGEFISSNQNLDSFMEVDTEKHIQFRVLYKTCLMASLCLGENWPLESLENLYKKDKKQWKAPYIDLHEMTLDTALQEIEKLFPTLVEKAIRLVTATQSAYWFRKDPIFHRLCSSGDLDFTLRQIRADFDLHAK